jgi:hypothetical protein
MLVLLEFRHRLPFVEAAGKVAATMTARSRGLRFQPGTNLASLASVLGFKESEPGLNKRSPRLVLVTVAALQPQGPNLFSLLCSAGRIGLSLDSR